MFTVIRAIFIFTGIHSIFPFFLYLNNLDIMFVILCPIWLIHCSQQHAMLYSENLYKKAFCLSVKLDCTKFYLTAPTFWCYIPGTNLMRRRNRRKKINDRQKFLYFVGFVCQYIFQIYNKWVLTNIQQCMRYFLILSWCKMVYDSLI